MIKKLPSDAFHYYVSLGINRSYQAVAEKYGVSKRTVTSRGVQEDWQGRVAELEAKARQKADQRAVETLEEANGRHLKLLRLVQTRAIEALKAMPLTTAMEAVRALDVTIRQERVVLGEPSDRTAVSVEEVIKRQYDRWMVTDSGGEDAADQDA